MGLVFLIAAVYFVSDIFIKVLGLVIAIVILLKIFRRRR